MLICLFTCWEYILPLLPLTGLLVFMLFFVAATLNCGCYLAACVFRCSGWLLGSLLCLCNGRLYWGFIRCRVCHCHCYHHRNLCRTRCYSLVSGIVPWTRLHCILLDFVVGKRKGCGYDEPPVKHG